LVRRVVLIMAVALCVLAGALPALGLPRFSLQEGEGCHLCHTNPSGGGLRNGYGVEEFGNDTLAAHDGRDIDADITDALRVGGDIRTQAYAYIDYLDGVEGAEASDDTSHDPSDSKTDVSNGFFTMQADLYMSWQLSDHASVYIEQDVLHGAAEVFGMMASQDGERYIKAGSFLPNYGLRIDDHTAFVRGGNPRSNGDGLLWEANYADSGFEAGAEVAEFYLTGGVYNGSPLSTIPDRDDDKAYLGRAERYVELGSLRGLIGGNVYSNSNEAIEDRTLLAGGFAGVGGDMWTLMGEVDFADNLLADETGDAGLQSLAVFVEGTFRVAKGVHIVERFEFFDPDMDLESGRFWRASLGAELYPIPHLELKPTFRYTGQPDGSADLGEALLQAHWWF
jgi:hypothetical protein